MLNMKQLFDYLIQYGGEIVSSNSLTAEDINQARASERMYVDENSYGFIWMPPVEKFPETEDELSLFEKWFPLAVEMPEHLKDSSVLFDKIEKPVSFTKELCRLLNKYSKENESDTPDFILAEYIIGCLKVFSYSLSNRKIWYEKSPKDRQKIKK